MLHSDYIKDSLKELYQKFIVIPIDKVSQNVAVICRFYSLTLIEELGWRKNKVSLKSMELV